MTGVFIRRGDYETDDIQSHHVKTWKKTAIYKIRREALEEKTCQYIDVRVLASRIVRRKKNSVV